MVFKRSIPLPKLPDDSDELETPREETKSEKAKPTPVMESVVVKPAKADTSKADAIEALLRGICKGMNGNDIHAEASRIVREYY